MCSICSHILWKVILRSSSTSSWWRCEAEIQDNQPLGHFFEKLLKKQVGRMRFLRGLFEGEIDEELGKFKQLLWSWKRRTWRCVGCWGDWRRLNRRENDGGQSLLIVDYFRCFNHYLKKDVFLHTVKVFFYKDPHKREKNNKNTDENIWQRSWWWWSEMLAKFRKGRFFF